jgi:hypothetical protein
VKRSQFEVDRKADELMQQGKRYYPKDGKGNLDEWAAIIKRQAEVVDRIELEK